MKLFRRGYAVTPGEEIERLNHNAKLFLEINMGATAIGTGINTLRHRCIEGIPANEERCSELVQNSIGIITALLT
ncbi:MAG: hypothetical protein WAW07_04755 [Bacteroidales bacterium]